MLGNALTLWIVTPLIGALIGWFTNFLAVKMLFRPRVEKNILFFKVQGLIPKRKSELATSIGHIVASELFNVKDIQAVFADTQLQAKMEEGLRIKVAGFIADKLKELSPMVAAMLPQQMLENIRDGIVHEIASQLPVMVEELGGHLEERLHVHEVIREKVEAFDIEKLEEVVLGIAAKELKHIELLGGVLGGVIGLINAALMHFVFLG